MPFTVLAFRESRTAAETLTPIRPVKDPLQTIVEETILVPALNQIILAHAGAIEMTEAKISTPSLRDEGDFRVIGINNADTPLEIPNIVDLRTSPLALEKEEGLSVLASNTAPVAPALADVYSIIFLADAAVAPVTGRIITLKATAIGTLTAGEWSNLPLTFEVSLPVGTYHIVGMRAESPNLIAARLVSPDVPHRPGVLGRANAFQKDIDMFRYGRMGTFLSFLHNRPPTVDFLATAADTNPIVYLDLIKAV